MRNKIRKIFLFLTVFSQIFALNVSSALAISIPSASSVASQLEKRYHMNLGSIQNQSEYFNTADSKKMAPQVTLSFSPTAPELGEKITAAAAPIYFSSANESMYFTWYLKHSSSGGDDGRGNRDHNDDGDIDIEDYKIEAMRLIANNGFNQNNADYSSDNDKDGYEAYFGGDDRERMPDHCYLHDFNSGVNYELVEESGDSAGVTCSGGKTAICVDSEDIFSLGVSDDSGSQCKKLDESPICSASDTVVCPSGTAVCSSSPDDEIQSEDQSCSDAGFASPTCSGSNVTSTPSSVCSHLFPWAYYQKDNGNISIRRDNNNNKLRAGRDSFGREEERFWHTNPEDSDTANNGNKDEANVAGLGQDTFSWNYQPGDKVGVAVEGVSNFSTKYDDASQAVMWALPKNDCRPSSTGSMTKNLKGYNVVIPIARRDLNDCLEDNLVDPLEEGNFPKLDVSLSYSPKSPVNDSSQNNAGDELVINSSVTGARDSKFLKYSWTVYGNNNINPENWGDPYLKSQLPEVGPTQGIGASSLKFKLNFRSIPKYLKVDLTVSESISAQKTGEGRASVIIPISSSSNKIRVYPVSVSDSLGLSLNRDNELCAEGMDKAVCPTAKNELIGMEVAKGSLTDFLWTIDGAPIPLADNSCSMGECAAGTGASTHIAYFPVLKEKGEKYNVGLAATDSDTGEKINLSKTFEVVDPEVKIVSDNEDAAKPVLLGNYVDLDGKLWPDYSEDAFEGLAGSDIVLKPELDLPLVNGFTWFIDGVEMTEENATILGASINSDKNTLTFPATKPTGESYSIGIRGLYTQDNNTKKYLNTYWGVAYNEFYETPVEDGIEIALAGSLVDTQGANAGGTKKFLAALFTGLPAYVSFLFRIVLTVMLILAVSWITMALTPKAQRE